MSKMLLFAAMVLGVCSSLTAVEKPRTIVTSDGEIDDQCSMVRFLLYANEWDVEGIITSSSQYHWQGHNWAGDDWVQPYLDAYAKVYPNLVKHDPGYPTPEYLRARTLLGNVKAEGEMEEITAGSEYIVKVLLDKADDQPVWLLAWGGPNTIARALKAIEREHPDQMAYVANKIRFFFSWEQDATYQHYIRPHWGKYNIPTIISDQFLAIAYDWDEIIPEEEHKFFSATWMKENILKGHGPLCALYKAHEDGRFRSEGDSPAFLHTIATGLRNMESPDWGGWGGRYVRVRENTWLDPVPELGYQYPEGRWYTSTAWGRQRLRKNIQDDKELMAYLKPIWRWSEAFQNDWAARADWCVKSYDQANHPPVVKLAHALDLGGRPGDKVSLSAKGTTDPDGDTLTYRWWQYQEADTYDGTIEIGDARKMVASFAVPDDAGEGQTIHIICEVTDNGAPPLTRYQRVVITVDSSESIQDSQSREIPAFPGAEGFGAKATGGRGGRVIAVTNLNDSGPGSLREAIDAKGPRTVVFRVSGTIPLKSSLRLRHGDITIAGQSAPGDGICLKNYSLDLSGANNVILRYLRVRPGASSGRGLDAFGGRAGENIIVDHCSMSWSVDECVSIYSGARNFTVQWCLISESLYQSVHQKGHHGFGGIWGGRNGSWHHNLLAHHSSRNPRIPGKSEDQVVDLRSNVIYNWGYNSCYGGDGDVRVNLINNVYRPGPATREGVRARVANPSPGKEPHNWWIVGNLVVGSPEVTADNWLGVHPSGKLAAEDYRANQPFEVAPVATQSAQEAFELVLNQAGATLPRRDSLDARIVEEARTGTARFGGTYGGGKGIIDSPETVGGWPELKSLPAPADTDGDGMPDSWETDHGLNPNDPEDRNGIGEGGYTHLEHYLNGLGRQKEVQS